MINQMHILFTPINEYSNSNNWSRNNNNKCSRSSSYASVSLLRRWPALLEFLGVATHIVDCAINTTFFPSICTLLTHMPLKKLINIQMGNAGAPFHLAILPALKYCLRSGNSASFSCNCTCANVCVQRTPVCVHGRKWSSFFCFCFCFN